MPGHPRRGSIARLVFATAFAAVVLGGSASLPGAGATAVSRWTGGIDLYRSGVFTTQKTWLWCTAADVQIIRNIVDHATDHSRSNQQRYFDYMRAHDRYAIPVSDGTDPGGWAAGLRHYVDGRYRVVASSSFDSALRSVVTNLRKTNLPVAITVDHGNHGWVLTGFTATADPAKTSHFTVTSVRVVGPLWGLQSRTYGYDMKPDTRLTPSQLKGFFTPWHYARIRMAWEGDWVSIQPIPRVAATARPAPAPVATPRSTPRPKPSAAPSGSAIPSPTPTPSVTVPATPEPTAAPVAVAAGPVASSSPAGAPAGASSEPGTDATALVVPGSVALLLLVVIAAVLGGPIRRVRASRRARTAGTAPRRTS
jgi:hypothetical protein